MSKIFTLLLVLTLLCSNLQAQVGIGTTDPDPSALLELESDTQGMLTPRMTTVQRNAITSPAEGLLVFDTDLKSFYVFNGSSWEEIESTDNPGAKKTGWVALTDANSSYNLSYVAATDLDDYSNYTHIDLDFTDDVNDGTIDGFAPTGTSSDDFFDSTSGEITPIAVGDALLMRLQFDATPDNNNTAIVVTIDIGNPGSPIIIYEKSVMLLRNGNRINKISESILLYQLGTFLSNAAKIKLAYTRANGSTTGTTCTVDNFSLVMSRLSAGN